MNSSGQRPPPFLTELFFSYKSPFKRVTKSKMRGDSNLSFTQIGTEIIEGKIQETLLSLESCHLFSLYKLIKTFKIRYFVRNAIISEKHNYYSIFLQ